MTPPDFFRELRRSLPNLEAEIAAQIVVGEAEKMWANNFRKGSFTDRTPMPWQPRKKKETPKRGLLVKTGTLRRQATKGVVYRNKVSFTISVPYGKVHNEGLRAGRGSGFTMPKRQFIGDSYVLDTRINRKAIQYINRRLKDLVGSVRDKRQKIRKAIQYVNRRLKGL